MPTSILNVHYTRDSRSADKSIIAAKSLLVACREVNYNENMESAARGSVNRVLDPYAFLSRLFGLKPELEDKLRAEWRNGGFDEAISSSVLVSSRMRERTRDRVTDACNGSTFRFG